MRYLSNLIIVTGIAATAFIGTTAMAQYTGISVYIEDYSTDWQFQSALRTTDINRWSFNLEEKTAAGLVVGVNIGQSSIRISDSVTLANTQKFNANSLGVYLRLPMNLSDNFSVDALLSYRINSGRDSNDIDPSELLWFETQIELGLSSRWQSVRFTPFVSYRNVDGDITNNSGIDLFDSVEEISSGIRFDYFIEPTAYIRFQLNAGANEGGSLVFAREY